MRILVASDIHGSSYYMQELAQAFEQKNCDIMVLLGDIYNHGPRNSFPNEYAPMKVAEILNNLAEKLVVVKGNCDSQVDAMISEFDFVDQAKMIVGGKIITFTHGHIYNKDNLPKNMGDCLIYGHFHTAFAQKINEKIVANCGSIALPKDNRHAYIIIDNNEMQFWDITTNNIFMKENI